MAGQHRASTLGGPSVWDLYRQCGRTPRYQPPADDAGSVVQLWRAALLGVAAVLTAVGVHLAAGVTAAEPEPVSGAPAVEVSTDAPAPGVVPEGSGR